MRIKSPKDFWAGAMFIAFGLFAAAWAAARYRMGTSMQMGPAYFPVIVGGLLAIVGGAVLARSVAVEGDRVPRFHFRPLFLLLGGTIAYGYLIQPLGLVLATGVLVYVSGLGGHEFRWKEMTLLFVALALFSMLVFVKLLTLPLPLWPEALQ